MWLFLKINPAWLLLDKVVAAPDPEPSSESRSRLSRTDSVPVTLWENWSTPLVPGCSTDESKRPSAEGGTSRGWVVLLAH
jgi:hypothetical protein